MVCFSLCFFSLLPVNVCHRLAKCVPCFLAWACAFIATTTTTTKTAKRIRCSYLCLVNKYLLMHMRSHPLNRPLPLNSICNTLSLMHMWTEKLNTTTTTNKRLRRIIWKRRKRRMKKEYIHSHTHTFEIWNKTTMTTKLWVSEILLTMMIKNH